MKFELYYLGEKIDEINVSSKQYARKVFFECLSVKEKKVNSRNGKI